MKRFCKVFEFDDIGQVLVIQDKTDPVIEFKVYPPEFGLVTTSLTYVDFEKSDKAFDLIKQDDAYRVGSEIISLLMDGVDGE